MDKTTSEKTTVIVAALDQKTTAKEVQEKLARNLGNTSEAGKIKKIITGKQQQVIIKVTGIEEAKQLKEKKINENEKLKNELKVTQPRSKTHEVIVYGIPDGTQQEDITKSITTALNKSPETQTIAKIFEDNNKRTHAIVKLPTIDAKKLITIGRILIGFLSCTVKPYHTIIRCFKCQEIGHKTYTCTNEERCGKCCGKHDTRKCEADKNYTCINCVNYNKKNGNGFETTHCAYDRKCPTQLKTMNDLRDAFRRSRQQHQPTQTANNEQ
ncbi:hypothetical protein CEXT_795201 [Caerostris extrusa]|uniref:CCHC-type domain-containing protein n=1 Tax=Caerostris extrusa TaxID=172846 RepID=A0AAV4SDZ5_CAEEX|nr:hypothetical protein CEXT_795201 [Caerostris extrusa]